MNIAIVGTGIAGLTAAWLLHREHEITVFEANDYVGGHTHTVSVCVNGAFHDIDTGFIVYNERNYPRFTQLLAAIGVATQPTRMGFSLRCDRTGLAYCGDNLNALFAQRRNLLSPRFYGLLLDILRFNRDAKHHLARGVDSTLTLGDFLHQGRYGDGLVNQYVVPMCAAIWSSPPATMKQMPLHFFLRFFHNHGLFNVVDKPTWRVIQGGSRRYVEALTAGFRDRIRLNTPVTAIERQPQRIVMHTGDGATQHFDQVFIAAHSDQALGLLADPTPAEQAVLGAIPYQANDVVLHTDTTLLPHEPLARTAWNYLVPSAAHEQVSVTYYMNVLQNLQASVDFCVTLNSSDRIAPHKVLQRYTYHHPMFTPESVAAQAQHGTISGVHRTHYCGAYWGYGFHEDGVNSAYRAVDAFRAHRQSQAA